MTVRIRRVDVRETPLQGLARLVTRARLGSQDNRGKPLTKPKAAAAIGISRQTLDNVENAQRAAEVTYVQLENFFGWAPGSITRFLDDNGPEPAPAEEPTIDELRTTTGRSLLARFGDLTPEDQAVVEAMIEALRKRNP